MMCLILIKYMKIRGGTPEEYLFPNDRGEQLTENALRCSISKYNQRQSDLAGGGQFLCQDIGELGIADKPFRMLRLEFLLFFLVLSICVHFLGYAV